MLRFLARAAAIAALKRPLPALLLPFSLLLAGAAPPAFTPSPLLARQQSDLQDVTMRVLLQQSESLPVSAGQQPLELRDADGALLTTLTAGEGISLVAAGGTAISLSTGMAQPSRSLRLRELWIAPQRSDAGAAVILKGRAYRGLLQIRLDAGQLQAINHIPLEVYLSSVVGSEMPASWPQAALQAQAVAARTYALAKRRPAAPFDVRATVASQVYRGIEGETDSTRSAVRSTRGQVLLYGNTLIEAVFHSSSGGSTENSGELWSRQLPYLVSVPDFDSSSPVREWRERFDAPQLQQMFPETGGVRRLDVLSVSQTGRIRELRVIGPRGSLLLTGAQLRQRLGLRSTLIQLELISGQSWSGGTPVEAADPIGRPGFSASLPSREAAAPTQTARFAAASADPARTSELSWGQPPPALPTLPRPLTGEATTAEAPPALVVSGKGFGHGVGMSQWGAHGMALQGKTYEQILRHYYRGVELRPFRASTR